MKGAKITNSVIVATVFQVGLVYAQQSNEAHSSNPTTSQSISPLSLPKTPEEAPGPMSLPAAAVLDRMCDEIVAQSFSTPNAWESSNRYNLNRHFNQSPLLNPSGKKAGVCSYEGQDTIMISMEGTGAFDPRMPTLMQRFARELRNRNIDIANPANKPNECIREALKRKTGKDPNWSGIQNGILAASLRTPELGDSFRSFHFPSEEVEALASSDDLHKTTLSDLSRDISRSRANNPRGVADALACIKDILNQAKIQGKKPKIVISSHSSGGRAAVKLLEGMKASYNPLNPLTNTKGINAEVLFTMDPVKEAHDAMIEAATEIGKCGAKGFLAGAAGAICPAGAALVASGATSSPTVRSRSQPDKLFRTSNVGTLINFYQTQDTQGLKMNPQFGIHGSPMNGADSNTELTAADGIGTDGHGAITYNPKVVGAFIDAIKKVRAKTVTP